MSALIHYSACPICTSVQISSVLNVKDHSVSQENFAIAECSHCGLRFTQDVPGPEAIAPYYRAEEYISHTNTSKGLINRIYKFVRTRTMTRKRKLILQATGLSTGTLLDLGSGVGSFVHEMKKHGWQVSGLEPDSGARKVAKEVYGADLSDTNVFYEMAPASFDVITMWHVMEHVHDLTGYVTQLEKILKENGRLFVAVPNYTSADAGAYGPYWAAYDVPRHLYHFSPASMKLLMEKHGLRILKYQPMWYDAFYISLLSSKYQKGRTNWPGALWNGLRSNMAAMGDARKCSSVIYVIGKA